jgi:hypothetical protein
MTSNYQQTASWLQACGKQPWNKDHLRVAVGVTIEEFVELLRTISLVSNTGITSNALVELAFHLEACSEVLKSGAAQVEIHDRADCLDALCDLEVTINGIAYMAGMNKEEGDRRTINSNLSKLNEDGTPVILEGGKIGKSDRFVPADYSDLV